MLMSLDTVSWEFAFLCSFFVSWCSRDVDKLQLFFSYCMSDGSLGSLHRWRSQRIAKCWSCELQDTLAHFGLRNTLLTERSLRFADYALCFHKACSALGWEWLLVFTLFISVCTYFLCLPELVFFSPMNGETPHWLRLLFIFFSRKIKWFSSRYQR